MKLAITIGLCVLAFVVGRQWPGREPAPTSAAPASAAETGARSTPSARASVRSRGVDRVTPARDERATIPTDRYDTAYLEAWRQDRAGAGRAKVAVLETLEVRRRAHDPALRACLETAGIHGLVKLRFSVTVESTPAELRVGAASLIEVVEGQPVPDAAGSCLERELAGDDVVPRDEAGDFLDGYAGGIDYVASFLMR